MLKGYLNGVQARRNSHLRRGTFAGSLAGMVYRVNKTEIFTGPGWLAHPALYTRALSV
jgi:hypothetical protein